ncbi:Uncharacterized membrane protein [Synechococcus sp. WH 7803]|nr:Uncharacterized membrane protein [Synechococcus sp. WH 7803]
MNHSPVCSQTAAIDQFSAQTFGPCIETMRALVAVALSLTALVLTLSTGVRGSNAYTTHIGMRVPPIEAKCIKTGTFQTDEGKLLNVYRCPPRAA